MNGKKAKITLLKQKIMDMKHELNSMINQPKIASPSPSPKKSPLTRVKKPIFSKMDSYSTLKSRQSYLQISPSTNIKPQRSTSNSQKKDVNPCIVSPVIKQIAVQVNRSYFKPNDQVNPRKSPSKNQYVSQMAQKIDNKYYSSNRNIINHAIEKQNSLVSLKQHQSTATIVYQPRIQKIKTYNLKKNDPILNPESLKYSTKKIVKEMIHRSPTKILTEHPKSNENLHIFKQKGIVLQRKGKTSKQKNKSSIEFFDESPVSRLSAPKQSNRKHFAKYFVDYY